jgi:nucleoside-diphosphate-sugar epimerase
MAAPRTALVTGATGFVGTHLARRLVTDGWDVHVVVRPGSDLTRLGPTADRVKAHAYDGTTEGLAALIGGARPDVVIHLASLFLVQHTPADVAGLVASNVLFGTQLAEGMVRHGVTRLLNTGTSWQHFEGREYSPVNLYAATKEAFAAVLGYYVEIRGLRVLTLTLSDTYGPDDPRPKLLTLLRQTAASRQPLAMSPGEQLMDLVHIDDVVEAYLLSAERLLADAVEGHECYAVSSGAPQPLREVVAVFEEAAGVDVPIQWGGRPYRPREMLRPWRRGATVPGWRPRVGLRDGIRGTLAAGRRS